MKIVLKTSFDELVEKDWKYIQKHNSLLIFQSYEWNYNWYKCNNFKKKLRIFIIYEENKPTLTSILYLRNFGLNFPLHRDFQS